MFSLFHVLGKGDLSQSPQKGFVIPLSITSILGILGSAVQLIPIPEIQYVAFLIQTVFRSFAFSVGYSFIACNFPVQHFGKLYGISVMCSGCVTFLQVPLLQSLNSCNPDFTFVNVFLLILGLSTLIHPFVAYRQAK